MGRITVTGRGRRRLLGGHPWVYADDVADVAAEPGELVPMLAPDETPLGWALFSSHSKIALRRVSSSAAQPDRAFWAERVRIAVELRRELGYLEPSDACRLLSGDADGLPGLVVDRYADVLVLQSGCQGSDRMRDFLLELVLEALPFEPRAILDRSDSGVRRLEALEPRVEWLRGEGGEPIEVSEASPDGLPPLRYEVDVEGGHKTGHYLDQRENRQAAGRFASGARVLDAFSYDGLFGIRCALAGAGSVVCLDQSEAAGERVLRNAERNGVADRVSFERANAMHDLRRRAREGERYDVVIVDPPAFARNKREAQGARRGYRELNRRAMDLVDGPGHLVSASCSYNIDRETFRECLAQAAREAGRTVSMTAFRGAAPDHPAPLHLPEADYLKCAFLRVGAGGVA